jgi:hypothetical protein
MRFTRESLLGGIKASEELYVVRHQVIYKMVKFEVHVPLGTNFVHPESRHKLLQFQARTSIIRDLEKYLFYYT